jgi:hypothetical protein
MMSRSADKQVAKQNRINESRNAVSNRAKARDANICAEGRTQLRQSKLADANGEQKLSKLEMSILRNLSQAERGHPGARQRRTGQRPCTKSALDYAGNVLKACKSRIFSEIHLTIIRQKTRILAFVSKIR